MWVKVRSLGLIAEEVSRTALAYISRHFRKICDTKKFKQRCPYELLLDLLHSSSLNVKDEKEVFDAVVGWVDAKREERAQYLPSLLSLVRFHVMESKPLVQAVRNHPDVAQTPEISAKIVEAMAFMLSDKGEVAEATIDMLSRDKRLLLHLPLHESGDVTMGNRGLTDKFNDVTGTDQR